MKSIPPLLAAAVLTLTACGGNDGPTPAAAQEPATEDSSASDAVTNETADTSSADQPTSDEPAETVEGPVSTLSPDIPEAYLEGLGPVDVAGAPLPIFVEGQPDTAIGEQVPTLVGLDPDGNPIRIDPATNGPAMIVFVAHWCPHCNAEIPRLNQLRDDGRFPKGLDIIAVATASRPDRPEWPPGEWLTDTMDWTYPAMLDGIDLERQTYIAATAYGVSGFPFVVLVNGDGTVADRWTGERDPDEVIAAINSSLSLT